MRRRTAAVLLAVLALALSGCGSKPAPAPPDEYAAAPGPNTTPPPAAGSGQPPTPPATPDNKMPDNKTPDNKTPGGPAAPSGLFPTFNPMAGGGNPAFPMPPGTGVPGSPMPPAGGNPAPPAMPPAGGNPPPGMPPPGKDPEPKEPKWADSINGRPLSDYVRDAGDPDPAIREIALRTIPQFGPPARKEAAKIIIARMDFVKELDPGVRAAAFEAAGALITMGKDGRGREIGFDSDADTKEAIRLLFNAADQGLRGGPTRLHAIQTLAQFGPKAEAAIPYLVGGNVSGDPAYQTRAALATALGMIAFDEATGPSVRALNCLVHTLIGDNSAAVRMAAYQSLVQLGPPWEPPMPGAAPAGPAVAGAKPPPRLNKKLTAEYVVTLKRRLVAAAKPIPPAKESPTGLVERDKQVEIYTRLALMRLEPEEINDENLGRIAKYINDGETGVRLQALNAINMMGEAGARRIDDVVKALGVDDLIVTAAAINTLGSMGAAGKPAVEFLDRLEKELAKAREQKWAEKLNDPEFKKAVSSLSLKPDELPKFYDNLRENMPEEQVRKQAAACIKYIKEAKPNGPKS